MDDLEFIQRCVKGDKQAWDEFSQKYSRLIYSCIHKVLYTKSYTFAQGYSQDIFQEIFSHLIQENFRKLKSFEGRNGCSLATWLKQVAFNLTIDYLRKIKPAVSLEEEIEEELSLKDILIDQSPLVTEKINQGDILENLKECIKHLDKQEQLLLELHINRGLKMEVLKGRFKLARGTLDMRKTRLIEKLKECFQNKGIYLR